MAANGRPAPPTRWPIAISAPVVADAASAPMLAMIVALEAGRPYTSEKEAACNRTLKWQPGFDAQRDRSRRVANKKAPAMFAEALL